MTGTFDTYLPLEQSRVRRVRLAAEVLDGVTLSRISDGLTLTAQGMLGAPIVNAGGLFVWLDEGGRDPISVSVGAGSLPFDSQQAIVVPPLPERLLRVELAPQRAYPFPGGVSGIRSRLVQKRQDNPPVPVTRMPAWLQWIDDSQAGTTWVDAPVRGRTDDAGDFAATFRFTPTQIPRLDAQGRLRVRLAAAQAGATLKSPELQIAEGRITDVPTFAWNEFQP
jgi:hypothetical protein